MVVFLSSGQHVHFFSAHDEPAVSVESGTRICLETTNTIIERWKKEPGMSEADIWRPVSYGEGNPATGPIYVHGARQGHALAVRINNIVPTGTGFSGIPPGAFGGRFRTSLTRFFDSEKENVEFAPGITLPSRPMVGVIGVAPTEGRKSTQIPGDHGGNLDASVICSGSVVYLPVFVPGGMICIGDVHLLMGDGEVNGSGIETEAKVEIEVSVIDNLKLKRPLVETETSWSTIASHEELEKAVWVAVGDMIDFLSQHLKLSDAESFLLTGLAAHTRICQIVNGSHTVRVEFPKEYLSDHIVL